MESNLEMLQDSHFDLVRRLLKSPESIMQQMTPVKAQLLHLGGAICSEAGELFDGIKRNAIVGKPLDRANIVEELGDLEFYMRGLKQLLLITDEEVLASNLEKLSVRHSSGKYSDEGQSGRADKLV